MIKVVKKMNFLKGRTKLSMTRNTGIYGPRYSSANSNNRRVRVRG
jgi:hypothetical protein